MEQGRPVFEKKKAETMRSYGFLTDVTFVKSENEDSPNATLMLPGVE